MSIFVREYAEWVDFWWEKAGDFDRRRILLIGDSITRSYRNVVQEHFKGRRIAVDKLCSSRCAGDPMLAAEMDLMTGKTNGYLYDVIHFNNGLHGVCNDTLIPFEIYQKGIIDIVRILRRNQPQAKIVIATSTPISPRNTRDNMQLAEDNAVILERNAFLRAFAERENLVLNDLYGLVAENPDFVKSDYVHFQRESAEKIGNHVSRLLDQLL